MASACVYIECPITGRILAVSRKHDPNDFGLPGGKVEEGEDERTAAWRELMEETGVLCISGMLTECFRREGGVTFMLGVRDILCVNPRAPGERGVVDWVTKDQLLAGCFGDYNRRLLTKLGRL